MSELDLQKITFFTEGNTFTGERTAGNGKIMRYLVKPDRDEDALLAYVWYQDVCYECAEITAEKSFPLTEEALDEIQSWLQKQFAIC